MDKHQNLKYGSSSESRSGRYPDLSMDVHQNLKYDFYPNLEYGSSSESRVWIIIKIYSMIFHPNVEYG